MWLFWIFNTPILPWPFWFDSNMLGSSEWYGGGFSYYGGIVVEPKVEIEVKVLIDKAKYDISGAKEY